MNAQEWLDFGQQYFEQNQIEEAERCCKEVLQLEPNQPEAHLNLANCYLVTERFQEGWLEYEWRLQHYPEHLVYTSIFKPEKRWGGFSSLDDKRLVVFFEQGFGDAIHFVRFLKELKKRYSCRIIAVCMSPLLRLFSNLQFVDEVWSKEDCFKQKLPEYDYHVSSMSLPNVLSCYDPISEPYISIHDHMGLGYSGHTRIGIAWTGSHCQRNDARSCDLDLFQELTKFPQVKLISLSVHPVERPWLSDLSHYLKDFEQTAKLMNDLDLIISVDTSVLHLAGAMGKPAWGLLAYSPDFRWGLGSNRTQWYPSIRLYRQPRSGDWESVFKNVRRDLQTELFLS